MAVSFILVLLADTERVLSPILGSNSGRLSKRRPTAIFIPLVISELFTLIIILVLYNKSCVQ